MCVMTREEVVCSTSLHRDHAAGSQLTKPTRHNLTTNHIGRVHDMHSKLHYIPLFKSKTCNCEACVCSGRVSIGYSVYKYMPTTVKS